MTLEQWVRSNRPLIDSVAYGVSGVRPEDDDDRELWVLNEESLYLASVEAGVREEDE